MAHALEIVRIALDFEPVLAKYDDLAAQSSAVRDHHVAAVAWNAVRAPQSAQPASDAVELASQHVPREGT